MDGFEAARIVFSRIQKLVEEPESASKIIGLLLLKDHGEQEMIRLACSPESHLHSVILTLKSDLALSSSSSAPFPLNHQHHLSLLNDALVVDSRHHNHRSNPNPNLTASVHHFGADADFPHRRSYSVSDAPPPPPPDLGADDPAGTAWKHCLYFTRGFCKNGNACRFLHHAADLDGLGLQHLLDPPTADIMMERGHQLLRSKSFNPRLTGASPLIPPTSPYLNDKYMNFLQLADSPR